MGLYELLQMYRLYRPQLAEATAEQYRYAIRSLEKFVKRPPTTTDLSEPVILRFLAARLAEVSPRTVRRERGDIFTLWCRETTTIQWREQADAGDGTAPDDIAKATVRNRTLTLARRETSRNDPM